MVRTGRCRSGGVCLSRTQARIAQRLEAGDTEAVDVLEQVGQVAANIRDMRRPEPYKGKGIMYQGEKIRRKEGKKK